MESIKEDEFYRLLSEEAGIHEGAPYNQTRQFFAALRRLIPKQMLARTTLDLPELGTFYLIIQKPKETYIVNGDKPRVKVRLGPTPQLKFRPCRNLKKYFLSRSES